jgi:hypothetical protein
MNSKLVAPGLRPDTLTRDMRDVPSEGLYPVYAPRHAFDGE